MDIRGANRWVSNSRTQYSPARKAKKVVRPTKVEKKASLLIFNLGILYYIQTIICSEVNDIPQSTDATLETDKRSNKVLLSLN